MDRGYWVRGVDLKHPEYEPSPAHEFELLDLRRFDNRLMATRGIEEVYHLAADMEGIGNITAFYAEIARNNDNSRVREALGWEPQVPLRKGLAPTYRWIASELRIAGRVPQAA